MKQQAKQKPAIQVVVREDRACWYGYVNDHPDASNYLLSETERRGHKLKVRVLLLREEGRCVAAGFLTPFRDALELPWSASTLEPRRKNSSNALLYLLCAACPRGKLAVRTWSLGIEASSSVGG